MSFANISLKENNSDIIYKTILEKIDESLVNLEYELDEIDYYASDEEIKSLTKIIEEKKQTIIKNKEQIYKLLKIKIE
jgi:hypothetical protein